MEIHNTIGTEEEQIQIESMKLEASISKFMSDMQKSIKQGRLAETPYGALLMKLGLEPFKEKLQEYFDSDLKGHQLKQRNLLQLITDDVDVLAYEVLSTTISMVWGENRTLTRLTAALMKKLFNNYIYGKIKEDNPKLHTYLGYEFRRATKRKKAELIEKNIQSLYDQFSVPEQALKLQVGAVLIELLELSGANIIEMTKEYYSGNGGNRNERFVLKFTEQAVEVMSSIDAEAAATRSAERLPCVIPPRDWTAINRGGYYVFRDRLVNFGQSPLTREFQRKQDYSKLFPVINKMQHTKWRVNARVLELVSNVFYNDLPIGDLPSSSPKTWKDYMTMPEYDEKDKKPWVEANRKRQQIQIDLESEFSKRLMLSYSIGTAKNMLKYKAFYYSYMLDYRGRVYPTSTHLNLLGKSEVKAMIEFGEGEYLTPDGVRWLKIHIANTYGLDKEPYDDRVEFVDEHYSEIMTVAKDPLVEASFLASADSPFEFAAACMAYSDHLEGEKVHIPIQLDATCSGIQMYSGLLRDKVGAKSVNVIGSSRNDIYQQVANGVEEKLSLGEYDAIVSYTDGEGVMHSVLTDGTANSLRGNITRKIVKRPTMTVPYSVTKMGMRNQIDDELQDMESNGKAFWKGERWIANRLITELTSDSIYSILDGAKKGQEYLVNLSRTLDEPAIWYTPIYNFPVHQNTVERNVKRVATVYGAISLQLEGSKHNKRKQSNQIAPNFIHSIDSTVLLGTVEEVDCLIGTIHDCFLVPPNGGYEVQEAYKKAFVETMEEDPIGTIQQQLDPLEEVVFPEYGDLDLDDVYDAQYIIS